MITSISMILTLPHMYVHKLSLNELFKKQEHQLYTGRKLEWNKVPRISLIFVNLAQLDFNSIQFILLLFQFSPSSVCCTFFWMIHINIFIIKSRRNPYTNLDQRPLWMLILVYIIRFALAILEYWFFETNLQFLTLIPIPHCVWNWN